MVPQPSQSKGVMVLRKMHPYLTDNMDPEHGLLGYLYSFEVITTRDKADVEAEKTCFDKNERLLKKLTDQNICDQKFRKFVDALKRSDQAHISSLLSKEFTGLSSVK